jgi:hypothetical protein
VVWRQRSQRATSVVWLCLAEAGSWLGGQLTTQAVPPDEHPWVERTGTTARYRRLRDAVRARYRADETAE